MKSQSSNMPGEAYFTFFLDHSVIYQVNSQVRGLTIRLCPPAGTGAAQRSSYCLLWSSAFHFHLPTIRLLLS